MIKARPHCSCMKLEAKKLLFDVITACRDIEQFTAGKTLGDYLGSELLRSGVERKFGIIGEALVRLRAKDRDTFDRIKVSEDAIAFRNRLVHGYDRSHRSPACLKEKKGSRSPIAC